MKKSVCIEMIFTELDFYDRFEAAKEAGFDYIEFWKWEDKNIDRIQSLIQTHDLKISAISGDRDYSLVDLNHEKVYIDFVKTSIKIAKKLKCKNLVIHSNALGEGGVVINHYEEKSRYEQFGTMVKILMQLAPIAEEADVILILEALNTQTDHVGNFLAFTKDSADLIKVVDSDNIKVLYDIYHMQLTEGKIIDTITQYHQYIGYIHVADVPGRMEPGTGEINYNTVFRAIKDVGYEGFIGFELSPSKDSEIVAKELIALF